MARTVVHKLTGVISTDASALTLVKGAGNYYCIITYIYILYNVFMKCLLLDVLPEPFVKLMKKD